jgi:hypothetical protein
LRSPLRHPGRRERRLSAAAPRSKSDCLLLLGSTNVCGRRYRLELAF